MIELEPHAEGVLVALRTVTMAAQPLKVGDAVAPLSDDKKVVAPCAVLYGHDGGEFVRSLGCIDAEGWIPFQVTSVGRTAAEARTVRDKTGAALKAGVAVAGRWTRCRQPNGPGSRVDRDTDVVPPLFYATTQYRLLTLTT